MNRIVPLLLTAAFVVGLATMSQADAVDDVQRAYFRVKDEGVKSAIRDMTKYEFPDGVVVLETSKKSLERVKKEKGLEFVDNDHVYHIHASYTDGFSGPRLIPPDPPDGGSFVRTCFPTASQKIGYGIKQIYQSSAITKTSGGLGVRVAVLDTGANITHPDIMGRIAYCRDFTSNSDTCEDTYSLTSYGHGTAVGSIVAADGGPDGKGMWGMASQSSLYILKVCTNSCAESDIVAGIYDAVINKSVNIISMSFGGATMSPVMQAALDYAYAHNILLVASAGNIGTGVTSIQYPAAYVKVIAAGAINAAYQPTGFTAPGVNDNDYIIEEREVEFGTAGAAVPAASKNGCGYALASGTSFAAPHVTGLAAKIWDGNATSTRTKLQDRTELIDIIGPPSSPGDDPYTGFGLPTVHDSS